MYAYEHVRERLDAGEEPESVLDVTAQTDEFVADAADLAAPGWFGFGKWAEAGRLAASAGDVGLLRRKPFRRFPERLEAVEFTPEVGEAVALARELLAGELDEASLPALTEALETITREAANL